MPEATGPLRTVQYRYRVSSSPSLDSPGEIVLKTRMRSASSNGKE
jgi:hypothetical protein